MNYYYYYRLAAPGRYLVQFMSDSGSRLLTDVCSQRRSVTTVHQLKLQSTVTHQLVFLGAGKNINFLENI